MRVRPGFRGTLGCGAISPAGRNGSSGGADEGHSLNIGAKIARAWPEEKAQDAMALHAAEKTVAEFLKDNPYLGRRDSGVLLPPEAILSDAASDASDDGEPSDQEDSTLLSTASQELCDFAGGSIVLADVLPDDFADTRHCDDSGKLKPRRPVPHIRISELLEGLHMKDGRWILCHALNGWPALVNLELRSITGKAKRKLAFRRIVNAFWATGQPLPAAADVKERMRATFRTPAWASVGWSPSSPGFAWWFTGQRDGAVAPAEGQFSHGELMVEARQEDVHSSANATFVHAFAHRYPVERETLKDKQTWHTGLLIEWSHGKFTTLVELAWLNGCGGYGGKSNWCEDKLAEETQLDSVMPESLKGPWDTKRAEIRFIDMPLQNKEEFEAFLHKYSEVGGEPFHRLRFIEPRVYASAPVRLRQRKPADLAGHMLNYLARARVYDQFTANCQTFTADAFAFLGGARNAQPYSAVVKPGYKQRVHSFLYSPSYV